MGLLAWLSGHWVQIVLLAAGALLTFAALRHVKETEVAALHQRNAQLFAQTLAAGGISDARIVKDSTRIGSGGLYSSPSRPFQVHLILHSPPDRWFVYLHTGGSAPVLHPISAERARWARK